jgi:beta-galactosidase/beta-glucuronidase
MPELPRAEHPRPDLQRERWLSLNGPWRFAFDPQNCGEPDRWFRPGQGPAKALTITVPFPWESPLSGVAAPDYQGAAWYEREIRLPDDWDGQPAVLHFGAVDWSARVWLNGRLIAEHANGYLPFAVDLGPHLRPGESATLTVRAFDVTDAATLVGKQVRSRSGWKPARPATSRRSTWPTPPTARPSGPRSPSSAPPSAPIGCGWRHRTGRFRRSSNRWTCPSARRPSRRR